MKAIRIFLALCCLCLAGSPALWAQDILGALTEAAEQYNEQNGQNSSGQNQVADGLSPWQEELQDQWEAEWDAQQNAELFGSLDSKYLQCTAMMVLYVHMYLKLVDEHKLGDISIPPCDAYGMQALALASSTTIMYCPEKLSELSDEELLSIFYEFVQKNNQNAPEMESDDDYVFVHTLGFAATPIGRKIRYIIKVLRAGYSSQSGSIFSPEQEEELENMSDDEHDNYFRIAFVKYLIEFFRPRYIIPQSLKIAQEMEAMGCSG